MAFSKSYAFTTQAIANNGEWQWDSTDYADHTVQVENTASYWCWTSTGSTSSSTGPPSGTACVYSETSSPAALADVFTMTMEDSEEVDASLYSLNVEFTYCVYGNTTGHLYFDAWDGSTWNNIASFAGNTTTTMTDSSTYDFGPDGYDYDNDDFKVRFRVALDGSGNAYQHDFAVSTVDIYGEDKVTKGAGMMLASAELEQGTAAAENPGTFNFAESLPWGAITLALREDTSGSSDSNLSTTDKLTTISTTGTVTVRDGATIDGLTINADVVLDDVVDLTNVTINGDLDIETGGTYEFSNVPISGTITNNDATANVTINASDGSSYGSLDDAGTGNGQENWVSSTSLTIAGLPTDTELTIVNASTRAELFHVENTSGATEVYSYGSAEVGTTVDILVLHLNYLPDVGPLFDYILTSSDTTIPITLVDDPTYSNP